MAILKGAQYTDFIMEVEARHEDNDASGIIFGMDPNNRDMYYQSMMHNDDWMNFPTDYVQGPFLKISKRNGLPCLPEMTPENDCYDLLAYSATDFAQDISIFPNGKLASVNYFPPEYAQRYEDFTQHNIFGKTVLFTLIVYQGQARVYFNSDKNNIVAVWTDLPADYVGGEVGLCVPLLFSDLCRIFLLSI